MSSVRTRCVMLLPHLSTQQGRQYCILLHVAVQAVLHAIARHKCIDCYDVKQPET